MDHPPSHPDSSYHLRSRLLACLERDRTLNDLAEETGATDARVLWHLERMAEENLVGTRQNGASWYRRDQESAHQERPTIAHAFPAHIVEDFDDALLELADGLYGDDAIQASGEHRTRLSSIQAAEFRDRLLTLIADYFAPGKGDRSGVKYGFHWILTPIDLHPLDESGRRDEIQEPVAIEGKQSDTDLPPRK